MDAFTDEDGRQGPRAGMSAEFADALLVRETGPDNAGLTVAALGWAAGIG